MQDSLFDDPGAPAPSPAAAAAAAAATAAPARKARSRTQDAVAPGPAPADPALQALAAALPPRLYLGTSSWNFPGWAGLVWDAADHDAAVLSRQGLAAYARHPLLRSAGIDRSFYRPMTAAQYAEHAAQVPDGFRFVVKAPSLVADAVVRGSGGRGRQENEHFLNPALALQQFVQPALEGLGPKVGALVFQLSPLPPALLQPQYLSDVLARLRRMLLALPALQAVAPDGVLAVEVRNPELLTPALAEVLREAGATYCLGLHPRLPPIAEQLPLLRALWPGPLVCRWNLNRLHGAQGYEEARALYRPFNALVDPDPDLRATLARVVAGTTGAGFPAYVTVNNKAEGSAPLSVRALAEEVVRQQG